MESDLPTLEAKIGYRFADRSLIGQALYHSSYVNEHPERALRSNERLEFIGDAVVNLIIGHILFLKYPRMHEGDLSRTRAVMVKESCLADIARRLDLGLHLLLGKGEEQTGGREKNSILADAYEALVAAVYWDGGFGAAFGVVESHFEAVLEADSGLGDLKDYKSRLQEFLQMQRETVPQYAVIEESGPDHDKIFVVRLCAGSIDATGAGKSKKAAEQDAARKALKALLGKP